MQGKRTASYPAMRGPLSRHLNEMSASSTVSRTKSFPGRGTARAKALRWEHACCAPGTVQSSVTGAGDGEGAGKEWRMT